MSTNLKMRWVIGAVAVAVCCSALAEMRTWRNTDGTAFRAEYVRQIFSTVVLQGEDGRQIRIPLEELSPADIDFICSQVSPEIEIKFSAQSELKERAAIYYRSKYLNPSDKTFIVTGTASFKKKSRAPFNGRLRAELFIIGQEVATPDYVLRGKSSGMIEFTEENQDVCELSLSASIRTYGEYNGLQFRGATYAGYVVIVFDPQGEMAQMESNFTWMTLEKAAALRTLALNDFFDKECREVPVPRPMYYINRHIW